MKKVLIISFSFSKNSIGSVRIRGLAKYLPEFGWESTILTEKSNDNLNYSYKIVETNYEDLLTKWKSKIGIQSKSQVKDSLKSSTHKNKKGILDYAFLFWEEIFAYPDLQKGWYKYAVEEGSKLLEREEFSAIISSSYPVTSHMIANKLKEKYELPWIADLRDLWTQNPYYNYSFIRKAIEKKLERNTLKNADFLTTTTPYSAEDLKKLHKKQNVYPILNGFDPDQKVKKSFMTNKLNLTYTGNLYSGKRDPENLFKALKELDIENKIDISVFSVDFYGLIDKWLIDEIEKYGLEEIVNVNGNISRKEVLKIQKETQLLLLLSWNDPKEKKIIPGKIYEYFAAERPILSIGPVEGLVKDLIESTNAGIHLHDFKSIKEAIKDYYDEFKTNGQIEYMGIPEEINKYNQKEMAKKFALILNKIAK